MRRRAFLGLRHALYTAAPTVVSDRVHRWRLLRGYKRRLVNHTYGGVSLRIELADQSAEQWYDYDWPPLPELEALKGRSLREGAVVFDIGAHQGVVALILATAVGSSGLVVAVEAQRHNCAQCRANSHLNPGRNVEVVHAAAAAETGTLLFSDELNGSVGAWSSSSRMVSVDAVTVDSLAARYGPPAVLLVDVEGFECQVLAGATKTIKSARPDCIVEVHINTGLEKYGSWEQVVEMFPAPDYDLFIAEATADQSHEFVALRPGDVLQRRGFLLALAKPKR